MPTSIPTYYIDEYVLDRYLILYERDSFYNDRRSSQSTDVQANRDSVGHITDMCMYSNVRIALYEDLLYISCFVSSL